MLIANSTAKTLYTIAYALQLCGGLVAAFGLYTLWVRFRDDVDAVRAIEIPLTVQVARWVNRSAIAAVRWIFRNVGNIVHPGRSRVVELSGSASSESQARAMMKVTFGGPTFDSERDFGDQFDELAEYVDEIRAAVTDEVRSIREELAGQKATFSHQFDKLESKQRQLSFSGFRRACIGIALILVGTVLEIIASLK